jgi:hypothetical protein
LRNVSGNHVIANKNVHEVLDFLWNDFSMLYDLIFLIKTLMHNKNSQPINILMTKGLLVSGCGIIIFTKCNGKSGT